MNRKKRLLLAIFSGLVTALLIVVLGSFLFTTSENVETQSVAVKPVSSQIVASGTVTSENEAVLHFQTAGKLTYLPFKEGDTVYQNQVIARLDTYALQQQLAQAANTYKADQDAFDQTQENNQAGVVAGQQRKSLDTTAGGDASYQGTTEETVVQDAVKRAIDEGTLNLQSASLNVDIANYAIQLASLTTPISGIITHEDVTTPGVNVTPTTSFVVDDPNSLVFRANVSQNDIDFVSEGSDVVVSLDGNNSKQYEGTVERVYPQKMTLENSDNVYQVDITVNGLSGKMQLGKDGSVVIQSNTDSSVLLIPAWVVLNHQYVWIANNGKSVLKKVTIGKTHGNNIEILSGLNSDDKIIINPKTIAKNTYRML